MFRFSVLLLPFLLNLLYFSGAAAGYREMLPGPVRGEVVSVLDGDTIRVRARIWLGTAIETSVRIDGIDAPEMKGKCPQERAMAKAAQQEVAALTQDDVVTIYNIRNEKYAGRVLAEVRTVDGTDIAQHMLDKGLARPYAGKKRQGWCG